MTARDADVVLDGVSMAYDRGVDVVHDVSLTAAPGSVTALLGPSGSGKTSLLRAVAGLERPTAGTVTIGGRVVSAPRTWVKPEQRRIGMVFQDGALFPHLSVADNIRFGLRGVPADEQRHRVQRMLALVDLDGYGDRLPATLSGGQQQRVALARSLAAEPDVLLLDEPFSALDASLRVQLRAEVSGILREIGLTTLFVTHDQDEAFVLGDRVAVMHDGRLEQLDTPAAVYRTPATRWAARFVGEANMVPATIGPHDAIAETAVGLVPVTDPPEATRVDVLLRPEDFTIERGGSARIDLVEYYGHDSRYEVCLEDGTRVAVRTQSTELFERGDAVTVRTIGTPTVAWPSAD